MLSSYSFAITVLNVCMCMSCHAEVLNERNVYALSCHGATNQQGRYLVSSFDCKGYCQNNTQSSERQ